MLSCIVLSSHVLLFMTLPLDSIMKSKYKCSSDNEANKSFKVMMPDEKIQILDKLCSCMNTAAVG
jgi:hypothetical protein